MVELYYIVGLTFCIGFFFYAAYANHENSIFHLGGPDSAIETLMCIGVLTSIIWPLFVLLAAVIAVIEILKRVNRNRHPKKKD